MNDNEPEIYKRIREAGFSELLDYRKSARITKTGIAVVGVILWMIIISSWSIFSILLCGPALYFLALMQVDATNVLKEIKESLKKFEGGNR